MEITQAESVKYLGVIIDSDLKQDKHIYIYEYMTYSELKKYMQKPY